MTHYPTKPGFYWAKWKISDEGTPREHDATPCLTWDVVQVYDRSDFDPDSPTEFRVWIPGVPTSQHAENFAWASSDPLTPPRNVELELRTNGAASKAAYLKWKAMTPAQRVEDWETRRKK